MPKRPKVWSEVGCQKTAFLEKSFERRAYTWEHHLPRFAEMPINVQLYIAATEHTRLTIRLKEKQR